MKKFKFKIHGAEYDTEIISIEDNKAEISINGTIYEVEVDKELEVSKTPRLMRSVAVPSTDIHPSQSKTASPTAPKGAGNIKSPLPGVILDIHVRENDHVKIGQKLITLEAMKMENNINADRDGKISLIKVSKGDNVMEGEVLIVIGD